MDESLLIKISVICSIAGLAILAYFSATIEFNVIEIKDITPDDIGITVKVCGSISYKYVSKNNHVFLKVNDGSEIDVVIFNNTAQKLDVDPYKLENQDSVCVAGRVDIYENELEIIPNNIELV